MRVISRKKIREFSKKHTDAAGQLHAWYADTKSANWNNTMDIKRSYRNASFISNNRVVFNIKGNKYRIIVTINYRHKVVYIRFIGTHKDYDKVDAKTI